MKKNEIKNMIITKLLEKWGLEKTLIVAGGAVSAGCMAGILMIKIIPNDPTESKGE